MILESSALDLHRRWTRRPLAVFDRRRTRLGCLLTLTLIGLVGGPDIVSASPQDAEAAVSEAADEQAAALGKLLLRTVEPLPRTEVASEDGFFKAEVPAKPARPMAVKDGVYVLGLDFGAGADQGAECHVHRNHLDPASSLLRNSDLVFKLLAETYGEISLKTLYGVDAGGIGAVPYLGVDWLYRTTGRGESPGVAGQAKHLIASKGGRTIYCQSTALGYDDAFFNLFKVLVATVTYATSVEGTADEQPFYEELTLVSVGEQVLGVEKVSLRLDAAGRLEERESRSLLVPVDGASLQAQDAVTIETGDRAGALISKVAVQVVNGEVTTQLRLSRERGETWKVGGVYQGLEIVKELDAVPLRSRFGRRADFRDFLRGAEAGASFAPLGWEPDLDPTLWTKTRRTLVGVDEGDPALRVFRVEVGGAESRAKIDGNLSAVETATSMGVVGLVERRVFVAGDPTAPPSADKPSADKPSADKP